MKKTLSVFLAMTMLLSCFCVFTASAEGGIADMLYSEESIAASEAALGYFQVENLPEQINDFDQFRKSSAWDDVSLMGIDLDFLYSNDSALYWSELDVWVEDENGKLVYGPDGLPLKLISKDDISLAFTNIGLYLQRLFYSRYGGLNLYTVDNAIGLANFIGKMLYPDFVELDPNNFRNYFTNEVPGANEFFRAITKLSGLDVVLTGNWIPRGKAFCQPVVELLGSDYIDFFEEYYEDGLILGSKILEAMIKKLVTVGPFDFAYEVLKVLASSSYGFLYRDPILALFTHKITVMGNYMTQSELDTFDGLLQLIFCNPDCRFADSGVAEFCPMDFPVDRFSVTTDKDEHLIYLYYYLNLCGRYKNNREFFENMKTSVKISTTISASDKIKLEGLIDGFFLGNFAAAVKDSIVPLYKENITTASSNIFERIKNAFMTLLKKIADYFDYLYKIFTGELEYGQGNSPFN